MVPLTASMGYFTDEHVRQLQALYLGSGEKNTLIR